MNSRALVCITGRSPEPAWKLQRPIHAGCGIYGIGTERITRWGSGWPGQHKAPGAPAPGGPGGLDLAPQLAAFMLLAQTGPMTRWLRAQSVPTLPRDTGWVELR